MDILICDPISPKGIALFQQRPEFKVTVLQQRLAEAELLPLVKGVEAMVVRSETKVTRKVIEAAPKLRVVGRAGVGVDNVDVDAATQAGHRGDEHARRQHDLDGGAVLLDADGAGAENPAGACLDEGGRVEPQGVLRAWSFTTRRWASWAWGASGRRWRGGRLRLGCGCWRMIRI